MYDLEIKNVTLFCMIKLKLSVMYCFIIHHFWHWTKAGKSIYSMFMAHHMGSMVYLKNDKYVELIRFGDRPRTFIATDLLVA